MSEKIENILSLPIEKKIGQLFFIGLPGEDLDQETTELLDEIQPGGICLFARNTKNAGKTRLLLSEITKKLPLCPFLSIDQEGGLVDRLRKISEPLPSPGEIYLSGKLENVRLLASLTAKTIALLGFNMNFAPVVDVTTPERQNFVMANQKRTFGISAREAYLWSGAYLEELQANGIIGCIKHFPGIGAVQFDPHEELPSVKLSFEELSKIDFLPFREHFQSGRVYALMTGHISFPETDLQETDSNGKLLPATLSPKIVTGLLRDRFGFQGLTITDDLEMGAIINNYGIGEASKMAFLAGNDLLLICNHPESVKTAFRMMLRAFENGEIKETSIDQSLERISKVRHILKDPPLFDPDKLAELSLEIKHLKGSL